MFGVISTEQTQADDWCVFLEAVITHIPHSSVLLLQHIWIHKNTQTLILSCVLLCVYVCVCGKGYLWVIIQGASKPCMHPSHSSSLQQGLICWCAHMLWETLHPMPCCARENQSHTKKDREKENHADTDSSNPPTRLGRTQPSGGSEARNSLLSSANLYMIEKKKGKKELCVASQLHRFRWWLAVHVSKFSTIFLLFNWATSCNYFLFDLIYCV